MLVLLIVCALLPMIASHGFLTVPAARQGQTGITNPGAGQCHVSSFNNMNNNGCQGAVAFLCYQECAFAPGTNDSPACRQCLDSVMNSRDILSFPNTVSAFTPVSSFNPQPRVGLCGEAFLDGRWGTDWSSGTNFPSTPMRVTGNTITVEMEITAYHFGWAEFRLCDDAAHVSQECFNRFVLRFDLQTAREMYGGKMNAGWEQPGQDAQTATDPSDYVSLSPNVRCDGPDTSSWGVMNSFGKAKHPSLWAPEGSCCNRGGVCDPPEANTQRWVFPRMDAAGPGTSNATTGSSGDAMNGVYKVTLTLPPGIHCTSLSKCTLQWLFVTGNSPDAYPEAFRNCADFTLEY